MGDLKKRSARSGFGPREHFKSAFRSPIRTDYALVRPIRPVRKNARDLENVQNHLTAKPSDARDDLAQEFDVVFGGDH
jgi:hypothetical protein